VERKIIKCPARVKLPFLTIILITLIIMIVASTELSSAIQRVYSITTTAISSPSSCYTYNPIARVITVSCGSATLTDIYNHLHGNNILSKQSPDGVWLLNAKLVNGLK
jgi:hypothetical protein